MDDVAVETTAVEGEEAELEQHTKVRNEWRIPYRAGYIEKLSVAKVRPFQTCLF